MEHSMHYNASDVDLDWELPQRSQTQVQNFEPLLCWGFIEVATCRPAFLKQEDEVL